jgi:hypothetical protein
MEYRKYFELPNVKWFCINDNSLLANSIDEVFRMDGIPLIKSNLALQEVKFNFPYFLITDLEGNTFLINQNLKDIDFLEKCVIKSAITRNILLVSKGGQTQLLDLNEKIFEKLLDYKIFKFIIFDQKLILYKNQKISFVEIFQKYLKWSFPLSSLCTDDTSTKEAKTPEVHQFIGVYEEKLWIRTNNGHFFALDFDSGKLLHHLKGVHVSEVYGKLDEYLGETDLYQFFFRNNYLLDSDRGVILGLGGDRFFEIDIKSKEPVSRIYSMLDQMKTHGLDPGNIGYNQVLHDNRLYFIAHEQARFGVINTHTKEIEFVSDTIIGNNLPGTRLNLKEIQVSDDKVYVLSSDGTLHIFENQNK